MHIEARLFEFLTAFFALAAVVYGTLTAMFAYGGIEWAGTTALVMTTGPDAHHRHVLPVRRAPARHPARGLRGRRDLRRRRRAGLLQPAQLVAAADRAVRLGHRGRRRAVAALADRRRASCFVLATAAGLVFEYYTGPEKH